MRGIGLLLDDVCDLLEINLAHLLQISEVANSTGHFNQRECIFFQREICRRNAGIVNFHGERDGSNFRVSLHCIVHVGELLRGVCEIKYCLNRVERGSRNGGVHW
ncbi:hypothetical protein D3C80_1710720 [compost metagenome]